MTEDLKKHFPHRYNNPCIDPSVLLAAGSQVHGDVWIGKESSVWFNAVLRGDVNFIRVGERTNIQDGSIVHVSYQASPCIIGNDVTVGHGVILHACTVKDFALVGMGTVVLDDAVIGEYSLIGAGSLITQKTIIPPRSKALGRPAKVVGELTDEEIEKLKFSAPHYVRLAKTYLNLK